MTFRASYGISAKVTTTLIIALFVALALTEFLDDEAAPSNFILIMPFVLLLVVGISYLSSVKHYEVTDSELIIHKPLGKTIFKKSDITSAALIDRKMLRFALRTFGIGGVFGHYGEFYTGKLGSMTWYRTRLDNPVMIHTKNKKIVLSPDEPQKFIAALQS
jgi:hypothetical protein